ncbi:MAG: AmpG family muropeptide MFS transporter [Gammaproteobacteria bacterium]
MTQATGWWNWWRIYQHPKVAAQLFLAFSAGLPFLLVFSTLSAWLKQEQVDLSTIGMLSWVGLAYTLKFFWAPVVDRVRLPWLTARFGRRRSWMLLAQGGIATGLALLAFHTPQEGLSAFVWLPLLVAFSSATQDIAIDAWRIESVPREMYGAMAAAYQLGYRIGITAAGAGALWIAADASWGTAYLAMAALMGVGVVTVLVIDEPQAQVSGETRQREQRVVDWVGRNAHLPAGLREAGAWFVGSVVCPFVDFFARFGTRTAVLILLFAGSYRLTDFTMGVMANPFYLSMGYSLKEIAAVVKGFGIFTQLFGAVVGGIVVARYGSMRSLFAGIVLVIGTNLAFVTLAFAAEPGVIPLALVIGADNIAMGVAGTALVAYLSGLTNPAYTATQYALFSSFYALPGKLLMGGSGFVVDAVGWPLFFVYTSALGIPALLLLALLMRQPPAPPSPAASPGKT